MPGDVDDYGADLDEIARVIERADVLIVRLQVIQSRLLVDFRTSPAAEPLIKAVPPAGSVEERFRSLLRLRPTLPRPERIVSFLWPRSLRSLEEAGVQRRISERVVKIGGARFQEVCDAVFGELREEEAGVLRAAIQGGDGFQALWERSA